MSKSLPSAVTTQMEAVQKRPSLLFELGLSAATLYYVAEKNDITFGGNTYSAKAITVSGFTQSAEGQINRITVNFDNVSRDMAAYATYLPFEGRPLVIKRIYKDAVSGTTHYNEVFRGTMEEISDMGRTWLPINATVGKPLYQKALLKEYIRTCRHSFGDANCNIDGFSSLASASNYAAGNILSGATTYMIIDTTVGSVTGTNDDAFNYGIIKIGKSGTTYIRTCYDWTSSTSRADWQVALPVTIDSTYNYQIYKGCPKDLNSCTMGYSWGPQADNRINFGGFLHIGKEKYTSAPMLSAGAEAPQHYYPPPPVDHSWTGEGTGQDAYSDVGGGPNEPGEGSGGAGPGGDPGDPDRGNPGGMGDWGDIGGGWWGD